MTGHGPASQALIDRIVAGSPGLSVLDVGCGTGIAARQFQAAGCHVRGIDHESGWLGGAGAGVAAEVATFETWDPAGRTFDAVIAAQAWHWVDPVAGAAMAARALRPGGRLTVFWNSFRPSPEWTPRSPTSTAGCCPTRRSISTGCRPGRVHVLCTKAADAMREVDAFGEPGRWRFDWERRYSRDEWLDQQSTFGGHNLLPPATLEESLQGIGAAIDAMGGGFSTLGFPQA